MGPKAGKKNQGKDMRGSKGRKLRYHEHEKIQNFMAPVGARMWHEEQIECVTLLSSLGGDGLMIVSCLRVYWGDGYVWRRMRRKRMGVGRWLI